MRNYMIGDIEPREICKSKSYLIIKRTLDIFLSIFGIIVLLPIFIITAIAIKVESSGPIIFKQRRVGKNSEVFHIYKFRSMKVGTPSISTEEFKNSYDFTTKVGRFIRKTSIDELPQLFNVLKGDISIVGPRPVIESEKELLEKREDYLVNMIVPGITGLAQINGRDNISIDDKVMYDYEYMKNRSLYLDISIIIKTFYKVLKSDGVKG